MPAWQNGSRIADSDSELLEFGAAGGRIERLSIFDNGKSRRYHSDEAAQ
jgi:hypothetical protein